MKTSKRPVLYEVPKFRVRSGLGAFLDTSAKLKVLRNSVLYCDRFESQLRINFRVLLGLKIKEYSYLVVFIFLLDRFSPHTC